MFGRPPCISTLNRLLFLVAGEPWVLVGVEVFEEAEMLLFLHLKKTIKKELDIFEQDNINQPIKTPLTLLTDITKKSKGLLFTPSDASVVAEANLLNSS